MHKTDILSCFIYNGTEITFVSLVATAAKLR